MDSNLNISKKKKLKDLTTTVTSQISGLVDEKKDEIDSDKKKTNKDIAKDLGISVQGLANYTSDRIPKYEELISIKEYFNVTYSYIFGDTSTKIFRNQDIGIELGLTDDAIETLRNLKSSDNENDAVLLFIINMLIENKEIARNLSKLMIRELSIEAGNKKYESIRTPASTDNHYEYLLYRFTNHIDNFIKKTITLKEIPMKIIKSAEKTPHLDNMKKKQLDLMLEEYNSLNSIK